MPKKRDYTDFLNFAKKYQDKLTSEQIYKLFQKHQHEKGEKGVNKKIGLALLREVFGYGKGEKKGQTLKEKTNPKKAHEYKPEQAQPSSKSIPKSSKFITLDKSKGVNRNLSSPVIRRLKDKIDTLFNHKGNTYIQIDVTIANDGYTKHNKFSVWIPTTGKGTKGKIKRDAKATGEKVLQNLKTFYTNLASKYGETPLKDAKDKLKDDMLTKISKLENELNSSSNITKDELELMFSKAGISIDYYGILRFTNNEREEGSQRWNKEHGLKRKAKTLNR